MFWSQSEDEKLAELAEKLKEQDGDKPNWTEIAECFPGRTKEQCRKRWRYKIDPETKRDKWTEEEESTLLELHKTYGMLIFSWLSTNDYFTNL